MINLLPLERKEQIRAGRANTILARYNILLLVAIGLLLAASAVVYFYLSSMKANAEVIISANEKSMQLYSSSAKQAKEFRSNLATAKQILDNQVVYSNLVIKIAKVVPSNVILTSLSLDSKTFDTSSTFQAQAKTADDVIKLKQAFQNNKLFKNVYFQSVSLNDSEGEVYPYSITFSATIDKKVALE